MTTTAAKVRVKEAPSEPISGLGIAVASLVEDVVDNALKLAQDVASDAARVAGTARDIVRSVSDEGVR